MAAMCQMAMVSIIQQIPCGLLLGQRFTMLAVIVVAVLVLQMLFFILKRKLSGVVCAVVKSASGQPSVPFRLRQKRH